MKLRNTAGTTVSASGELARRLMARGWRQVGGAVAPTAPPPPVVAVEQVEPVQQSDGDDVGWQETSGMEVAVGDPPTDGVVTLAALGVPSGSAREVLDWVGDDPERASAALDAEQAKGDDARTTLMARLSRLAGR